MAVAFDFAGGGASSADSTASITWEQISSGSNRALILGLAVGTVGNDVSGWTRTATCGGVAMSSLGVRQSNDQPDGFVELFGLLNQPSGSQAAVVSATKSGVTPLSLTASTVSYTGVGSFGTAVTGIADSVVPSLVVSSATNRSVVGVFGSGAGISTPTQTSRYASNWDARSAAGNILIQDAAGASSVTLAAANNSDWWAFVGVSMNEVGAVTTNQFFVVL